MYYEFLNNLILSIALQPVYIRRVSIAASLAYKFSLMVVTKINAQGYDIMSLSVDQRKSSRYFAPTVSCRFLLKVRKQFAIERRQIVVGNAKSLHFHADARNGTALQKYLGI